MLYTEEKIGDFLWVEVGQAWDYSARYEEDIYVISLVYDR